MVESKLRRFRTHSLLHLNTGAYISKQRRSKLQRIPAPTMKLLFHLRRNNDFSIVKFRVLSSRGGIATDYTALFRALNVFLPWFISSLCSLTPADALDLESTLLPRHKAPTRKAPIRPNFGLITVIRKIWSKQNLENEFSVRLFFTISFEITTISVGNWLCKYIYVDFIGYFYGSTYLYLPNNVHKNFKKSVWWWESQGKVAGLRKCRIRKYSRVEIVDVSQG